MQDKNLNGDPTDDRRSWEVPRLIVVVPIDHTAGGRFSYHGESVIYTPS